MKKTPQEQLISDLTKVFKKFDSRMLSERVKRGIEMRKKYGNKKNVTQ